MPQASQPGGTTWNTESDLRTRFPELVAAVIGASEVNRNLSDTEDEIKEVLRPYWDVDDTTYWSSTNIPTYAPSVKSLHVKLAAARCYLAIWGKSAGGADAAANTARLLEDEVWAALERLIERGALNVSRRSDSPDTNLAASFSSGGNTDAVFDYDEEDAWPRTPSSGGTRDVEPY